MPFFQLCIKVYGFEDIKIQEEKVKKGAAVGAKKKKKETNLNSSKGTNDTSYSSGLANTSSGSALDFNVVSSQNKFLNSSDDYHEAKEVKKMKNEKGNKS